MATHKSALKRHKQSVKKNLVNTAARTKIRNLVRAVAAAVDGNDRDGASKALLAAIPALQRAAAKGIIHRNTASRNVSRLTLRVNALSASAPVAPAEKKHAKKKTAKAKSAAK